jgi:hypothetical protein
VDPNLKGPAGSVEVVFVGLSDRRRDRQVGDGERVVGLLGVMVDG